jgi:transcriptional regulator with XRE-family HTH domain
VNTFNEFRANLKRLRKSKSLTQEQLAEKSNLDYKHYQKIEGGRWDGLQLRTIEQLAGALDVSPYELLLSPSVSLEKQPKIEFKITVDLLKGLMVIEAPKNIRVVEGK